MKFVINFLKRSLALSTVLYMACSSAQTYPTKPIQIIVPYPAGGVGDLMIRRIAEPLSREIGQPVVIDNRPGANGAIGVTRCTQAPPDGYTLCAVTNDQVSVNPFLYTKLAYDLKQLTPVVRI